MSKGRSETLSGGSAVGDRDFWVSVAGKRIVLEVNKAPVRFNLLVSRRQWGSLVKTLKCKRPELPDYDAFAGFLFSDCRPLYYRISYKPEPWVVRGRETQTVPTPKGDVRGIRSSGWTKEVTLEHQGTNYFIRRDYFLKMRNACLKLAETIKAGK